MAYLNFSTSSGIKKPFSESVTLEGDKNIKKIKKFLPINQGDSSGGYVYRVKVEGEGKVILHEVGFNIGIRG